MRLMPRTNASVELVLADLRNGIKKGHYAPGQHLNTATLAARLRTSQAPIREALHLLVGEGLVELHPNRGVRVRTLNARSIVDALQMLEAIGALAFALMAPKLQDPGARAAIETAYRSIFTANKHLRGRALLEAITGAHRLIGDHCGNSFLGPLLDRAHLDYFYHRLADALPDSVWDRHARDYRCTAELLIRGDRAGAERAWRQHIRWIIGAVGRHLK
jgi:DNA-binding GntR family transcriptional regulator